MSPHSLKPEDANLADATSVEEQYRDHLEATLDQRYRIIGLLGHGGMGAVFLAQHTGLGKPLAVKILDCRRLSNAEGKTRLFREAQAAARIGHPNIIDVLDIGVAPNGDPFLVMEYLEGENLANFLEREGPLSLAAACAILEPVLLALQAAHSKDIIHRDVKPDNVYLVRREEAPATVKLIDFGIAKLTGAGKSKITLDGTLLGTPNYMSPEQAKGATDLDRRADLFSVGVIFFEMLTGTLPFDGANYNEVLHRIANDPIPSPNSPLGELPEAAVHLVRKALAKDPSERHQSASEFLSELSSLEAWPARTDAFSDLAARIHTTPAARAPVSKTMLSARAPGETGEPARPPAASLPEVRIPASLDATLIDGRNSVNKPEPPPPSPRSPSSKIEPLARTMEPPLAKGRNLWAVPLGVVAALVVLGLGLARNHFSFESTAPSARPLMTSTPSLETPERVHITVTGVPEGATIFYDGKPMRGSAFEVAFSTTVMPIRVELDGHEPFQATLVPSKNTTLRAHLNPLASPPIPSSVPSFAETVEELPAAPKLPTPAPAPRPPETEFGKSGRDSLYYEKFE